MKKIIVTFQIIFFVFFVYASDTTRIIILHTNDTHAKIDNMAKIAFQIEKIKQQYSNVFVFSAGDIFTGNPIVDKFKDHGYPMIDLMNDLQYDVSCLGNHEFDYGQGILNQRISQANFPFICANIDASTAEFNQPKPFVKFTVDNLTIGIVGFIQIDDNGYPASNPLHLDNLKFTDAVKTANEYKKYSDSADVLIALSHLGYKADVKLAKKLTFFDVIIGGHSHTLLPEGHKIKQTLVVQAGSYNEMLGVLTILYVDGKVVSVTDSIIDIENSTEINPDVQTKIDNYNINPYFETVIGYADFEILGDDQLGALMTDAMRDTLSVDIAFQNIGGIRIHTIPQGDITIKQILELSPFGNTFFVMDLTVSQIKKLIEYTYKFHNSNELQVSGVNIKLFLKPNGKLKKIKIENYNGTEITEGTFSVAVNNYMALSYSLSFLKNGTDTGIIDAGCTMAYIKKQKKINYSGVKRVIIVE
ncbi:MAG: bifunctional metallophosphatase/5'-nucleotidase [Bacteroidales bacterium]|nr:bifunctional metallophosphatase/5'-nucleotidase [Bacteroidales bacterium]